MTRRQRPDVTDPFLKALGEALRGAREQAGYETQSGAEAGMSEAFRVSSVTLSGWETGKQKVSWDHFKRLCELYGTTTDSVLRQTAHALCINQDVVTEEAFRFQELVSKVPPGVRQAMLGLVEGCIERAQEVTRLASEE